MFNFYSSSRRSRGALAHVSAAVIATAISVALRAQPAHDHAAMTKPPPQVATPNAPTPSAPAAADTADALNFASVLSRYKPMTDQKLGSWRDANDTVTRIGGWRAYLKEAQAPSATTAPMPAVPQPTEGKR